MKNDITDNQLNSVKIARRATWVGFWVNAILGIAKVVGGIIGRSSALVADGIHSFSDFLSDIIIIVMIGKSRQAPDHSHQFGHGRYETMATLLLAVILLIVAILIFIDAVSVIRKVANGLELPRPGVIAIIILFLSIASKEWLFHYTRNTGKKIHSDAVIANAWHHRSDAFSSIATLIGVGAAFFLGPQWRVLDPIAAMIVAIFIAIVSFRMIKPAASELLGASLPSQTCQQIENTLTHTKGVKAWSCLRTFKSGNEAYVEVHILVDPKINVESAHKIASNAEANIIRLLAPLQARVTTHIEPFHGQPSTESCPHH